MNPSRSVPLLCRGLVAACLAFASCTASAADRDGRRRPAADVAYDIGTGSLDGVLGAFIQASDIQLLYSPSLVRGKRSSGLKGRYRPTEALARLLGEQNLTAVAVTPNTYLLQPVPMRTQRERRDPPRSAPASAPAPPTQLAAVTVVGSRIPRDAFDSSVPVRVVSAEDIRDSGVSTLYELLREQPGMFGHHPVAVADEGGGGPRPVLQPIVTAASASLYSLGPRGTLYLVDGRRVTSFGLIPQNLGGLFDLNSIPLSFIDRIEILRGAASANYGADAAAGAVNIVLKKDIHGTDLAARHGVSSRGDARTSELSASYGAATRGGGSFFVGVDALTREELPGAARPWHTQDQGQFGLGGAFGIVAREFPWLYPLRQCERWDRDSPYCYLDTGRYRTLEPRMRADYVYAHWQRPLGESMSLELSARHSRVEQTVRTPPQMAMIFVTPQSPVYPELAAQLPQGYTPHYVWYPFYDVGPISNRSVGRTLDLAIGLRGTAGGWNWKVDLSRDAQRADTVISNLLRESALDAVTSRTYRLFGDNDPALLESMRAAIRPSGRDTLDSFEASVEGVALQAPGGPARIGAGLALRKERMTEHPDPLQAQRALYAPTYRFIARDLEQRSASVFAELRVPVRPTLQLDLAANQDRDDRFDAQTSSRVGLAWSPHERLRLRASFGRTRRAPTLQELRSPFVAPESGQGQTQTSPACLQSQTTPGACLMELAAAERADLRPESSRSASIGITFAPTQAADLRIEHYRIKRWDEFAYDVAARGDGQLVNHGGSESRGWDLAAHYLRRSRNLGSFDFRLDGHYLQRHIVADGPLTPSPVDDAGHLAPKLSVLAGVKWEYRDWAANLSLRHFGRSRTYLATESCRFARARIGRCTNPSATLLHLGVDYAGFERWTISVDVNNLGDHQPANYLDGGYGYNIAVDDPYGRYYTLTTAYRF